MVDVGVHAKFGGDDAATLRELAERLLGDATTAPPVSPVEELRLLHELQVHHVELQLQNEQLQQEHAEAAAARDRYARLFELSPVGVIEMAADGSIVEANLAAARMLQGSQAELAGARLDRQLAPASVPAWRALLAAAGQTGRGHAELELARPGSLATVWQADSAYDAATGSVLVTLVDISERSRAQAAQREAALTLAKANRAKNEFLSRMSHELRTPLNAVLGFAQLLLADDARLPGPAQRAQVEHIERAGRQLLAVIEESMDIARIESGRIDLQLQPLSAQAPFGEDLPLTTPVSVSLPLVPVPAGAAEPAKTGHAAAAVRKSRRVLFIGDLQADRDLIEAAVHTLPDVTLTTAIDARSGIPTARILHPDLVIIGLGLPDMDGAEVLRALRQQAQTRQVRCIALSADASPGNAAEAAAAGFLEFWPKPLGGDLLRSRLRALLG